MGNNACQNDRKLHFALPSEPSDISTTMFPSDRVVSRHLVFPSNVTSEVGAAVSPVNMLVSLLDRDDAYLGLSHLGDPVCRKPVGVTVVWWNQDVCFFRVYTEFLVIQRDPHTIALKVSLDDPSHPYYARSPQYVWQEKPSRRIE